MNVFIIDDHRWLVRRLCEGYAGNRISALVLAENLYKKGYRENPVDKFFEDSVNRPAWRNSQKKTFSLKDLNRPAQAAIFLINADLKINESTPRQEQNGVEILKHLRLTEELTELRGAHVVLYSFRSLEQLLRHKPGNLILLSPGVSFVRLPEGLDKLGDRTTLIELASHRASVDDALIPYIQGDFRLPDAAHPFSNWWGVRQLVRTANAHGHRHLRMPKKVDEEIQKLNNKKALFLYGREKAKGAGGGGEPISRIGDRECRVLHLDDEAEWSEVLREIIREDAPKTHFKAVGGIYQNIAEGEKETEDWVEEKLLSIDGIAPDLVLLDLRLYRRRDAGKPVEQTSGAIVAKTIRRLSPGTPIILMTASNKAWVFEEMMKIGVDAYWMKEGVGDHLPPGGSLNNYETLRRLISSALGEGYQFLRRVAAAASSIKNTQSSWWESYTWRGGQRTSIQKDLVCSYLDSILLLLREYLHLFQMGYGYTYAGKKAIVEASWLNALLMEATKVVELIHNFDKLDESKQGTVFSDRHDNLGRYIYSRRSRLAAHAQGGITQTSVSDMREAISGLLLWIQKEPTVRQIPWLNNKPLRDLLASNRDLLKCYKAISSGTGSS